MDKAAERAIGSSLPSLTDIYTDRLQKKASNIAKDTSHPGGGLGGTNGFFNSFYPPAARAIAHMSDCGVLDICAP